MARHDIHDSLHPEAPADVQGLDVRVARARPHCLTGHPAMGHRRQVILRMAQTHAVQLPGLDAEVAVAQRWGNHQEGKCVLCFVNVFFFFFFSYILIEN